MTKRAKKKYDNYKTNPDNKYIVVEGNRRLATIQGLLSGDLAYLINDDIKKQLANLPILFYPNRKSVLNFLGVHHLAGVRKWNVYARARYIVGLKREQGYSIDKIQNIIGDKKNSAKKTYVCYRLLEIVAEYDESFVLKDAKNNFSFLQLATGQGGIKNYLGLKNWKDIDDIDQPIPADKKENLKNLFLCLFDNNYGDSYIRESRDITGKLNKILDNEESTKKLLVTKNIDTAYALTDGVGEFIKNSLEKSKEHLKEIVAELVIYKDNKEIFKRDLKEIESYIEEIKNKLN